MNPNQPASNLERENQFAKENLALSCSLMALILSVLSLAMALATSLLTARALR